MGKPLYVFDFDGVIADSLSLCLQACEYAAGQYGRMLQLDRNCWELLDEVTFEAMARSLGFEDEMVEGFAGHVFAYNRRATPPAVFAGMHDALPALAASGELVVLSANHSRMISGTLAAAGLMDTVTQVIGGETPGSKSVKLEGLLAATSVAAEDSWMIGDAVSDIRAAHEVGCRAAAVSWGWQSPGRLASLNPERIVTHPLDLIALAGEGNGDGLAAVYDGKLEAAEP